jgi:hypothetical protein
MNSTNTFVVRYYINRIVRFFFKNTFDDNFEKLIIPLVKDLGKLNEEYTKKSHAFIYIKLLELGFMFTDYTSRTSAVKKGKKRKRRTLARSFWYKRFKSSPLSSEEQVYEITRQGYVQLYHKYENFRNELIQVVDECLSKKWDDKISIRELLWNTMRYEVDDLKTQPERLQKINWICNCVKHKNGFPIKKFPPKRFDNVDKSVKIKIDLDEFTADILYMINLFAESYSTYLGVGAMAYMVAKNKHKEENDDNAGDWKKTNRSLEGSMFMLLHRLMNPDYEKYYTKEFVDFLKERYKQQSNG